MGRVVGHVEQERLLGGGGFIEKLKGKVGDGVGGVKGTPVQGLGNLPALTIETE